MIIFVEGGKSTAKLMNSHSELQMGHLFSAKFDSSRQRAHSICPHDENTPRDPGDLKILSKDASPGLTLANRDQNKKYLLRQD